MKLYFENKKRLNETIDTWDFARYHELVIQQLNEDPDLPDEVIMSSVEKQMKKEGRKLSSKPDMRREFNLALSEWENEDESWIGTNSDPIRFEVVVKYYDKDSADIEVFVCNNEKELEDKLNNNSKIEWWDYFTGQLIESKKRMNEAFDRGLAIQLFKDVLENNFSQHRTKKAKDMPNGLYSEFKIAFDKAFDEFMSGPTN